MSDEPITVTTGLITVDLTKPLPWWLRRPLEDRVMIHAERRKKRAKRRAG